jgi:hypothetical protein
MSRSRWLVFVSFLAVTITVLGGPTRAEQPVLPPPPSPAPSAPPPRQQQPQPQPGPPLTTSATPRLPPAPVYGGTAQPLPPGTRPPGATQYALPVLSPAPMTWTKHYPLAVMVADAAWSLAAYRLDSPALAVGGYIGAAPLVHAMMRNTRGALISGGLRAAAVVVTAVGLLTIETEPNCFENCEDPPGALVYAGLIGAGAVVLVDWMVLAKKEVPVAAPMQARSAPDWAVTPQVQVGLGGLQVGVGGWF